MKNIESGLSKFSSFKIVLFYAIVSTFYIYTSDYFLQIFTSDIGLLSQLQTYKGFGFILITSVLLYVLVKKNIDVTTSYYRQIIDVQAASDKQIITSQKEYMTLFDNSPLPMWLFDPNTLQFLLVNEAACRIYQYSHEEFLSMTLRDIRPQEDIPLMEQTLIESSKKAKNSIPNVLRHKKRDGEIMQVKIDVVFVDYKGRKTRLATVSDVTSEIEVQNNLLETNSRLQRASEIAGLGYWTNDLVKSEIHWSDELYKIFELDPKTFTLDLNNIKECFHPDERFAFTPEFYSSMENKTINESERRITTGTGEIKWISERLYLTRNEYGVPVRIEGIVLDVTRRKLYEQGIRESNERFKMLAKATVEAIVDWDIKNKEVIWGEGFHTILGYDLREPDLFLWSKNIHPDDKKKVLEDLIRAIKNPLRQYFNAEFRFLKANGDIAYIQQRGVFIRDERGKAIRALGAMIDLTEALTKMRKIELQDKALKEIAWTQSHVVRAPLANLMGLVGLIKNEVNTGVNNDVLLGHITDSAEKLDRVIRDIVIKAGVDENHQSVFPLI